MPVSSDPCLGSRSASWLHDTMTTHATDTNLKRTALAHVHEALGAKMVPFALTGALAA